MFPISFWCSEHTRRCPWRWRLFQTCSSSERRKSPRNANQFYRIFGIAVKAAFILLYGIRIQPESYWKKCPNLEHFYTIYLPISLNFYRFPSVFDPNYNSWRTSFTTRRTERENYYYLYINLSVNINKKPNPHFFNCWSWIQISISMKTNWKPCFFIILWECEMIFDRYLTIWI